MQIACLSLKKEFNTCVDMHLEIHIVMIFIFYLTFLLLECICFVCIKYKCMQHVLTGLAKHFPLEALLSCPGNCNTAKWTHFLYNMTRCTRAKIIAKMCPFTGIPRTGLNVSLYFFFYFFRKKFPR